MRFRKSISLGKGTKINLSGSGVGLSTGVKGLRIGAGPRGIHFSAGIPGTGLHLSKYYGKKESRNNIKEESLEPKNLSIGCLFIVFGIIIIIVGWILSSVAYLGWIVTFIGVIIIISPLFDSNKILEDRVIKAEQFLINREYVTSLSIGNELYIKHPNNFRVLQLLFFSLCGLERYSECLAYAERLYTINNDDDNANNLSHVYVKLSKFDRAIPIIQKHLKEMSDKNELRKSLIVSLGICFFEKKQYDVALEAFRQGPLQKKILDQDLIYLHYCLGLTYEKLNDKKNALKHLKKVYLIDMYFEEVKEHIDNLEKN